MRRPARVLGATVAGAAALAAVPLLMSTDAQAAKFTGGNLVVYRVGNGTALTNAAAPVFLDEYTAAGSKVQSLALPTTAADGNHALTAVGQSRSEGLLSRSADGHFLTLTGYDAAPGATGPGGTSLTASTPASTPRVVGVVDGRGGIDTSTVLAGTGTPSVIRSAASTDGDRLWVTGGNGGVRATALGSDASSLVAGAASSNHTSLTVQGGQLFAGGILADRLAKVGTGTPTGTATATAVAGLPDNLLTYGYALLDLTNKGYAGTALDTLYLANASERAGTVDKYTFDGTAWSKAGYLDVPGATGLVADKSGASVTLAVTTPGKLLAITDPANGAATFSPAAPSTLASAPANTEFRGVALAPTAADGPSVFVREPVTTDAVSLAGASATVSALVTAGTTVSSVTAKLGNGAAVAATKGAGNVWTATVPLAGLSAGATTLTVAATDSAGTPATTTVTKQVQLTKITAPAGAAAPGTYAFTNKLVTRVKTWSTFKATYAPGKKGLTSKTKGAKVNLKAYGRQLVLTFTTRPDAGKVKVTVDGKSATLNLYAAKTGKLAKTFSFGTGAVSQHQVTITVVGKKVAKSKGTAVFLGTFAVKG